MNTATPEPILITIFSDLNFTQLSKAKRVCKKWKKVIDKNDDILFKKLVIKRFDKKNLPVSQSRWQNFYIELYYQEHIVNRREQAKESEIQRGIELDDPIEKGLRRLMRRAGIVLIDPPVYGFLEKQLSLYLSKVLENCANIADCFQIFPYVDIHTMNYAVQSSSYRTKPRVYGFDNEDEEYEQIEKQPEQEEQTKEGQSQEKNEETDLSSEQTANVNDEMEIDTRANDAQENKEKEDNEEDIEDYNSEEEAEQYDEECKRRKIAIQKIIEKEKMEIEKIDEDSNFCSDYFEENYDALGYFPTYEEDRRGMDFEYNEDPKFYMSAVLRSIRQRQQSDENMFPLREFQHLVQSIGKRKHNITGLTQNAYNFLLNATEGHFTKWMYAANLFVVSKRTKIVTINDFKLARNVLEL